MAYHANDTDPPNCPICNTELHSINTKRIGNKAVCKDCAFKLMELWYAVGDHIVLTAVDQGIDKAIRDLTIQWMIVI